MQLTSTVNVLIRPINDMHTRSGPPTCHQETVLLVCAAYCSGVLGAEDITQADLWLARCGTTTTNKGAVIPPWMGIHGPEAQGSTVSHTSRDVYSPGAHRTFRPSVKEMVNVSFMPCKRDVPLLIPKHHVAAQAWPSLSSV